MILWALEMWCEVFVEGGAYADGVPTYEDFKPYANTPEDLTIYVSPGRGFASKLPVLCRTASSKSFVGVTPAANPRQDLLVMYVPSNGTDGAASIAVAYGAEAASPADPTISSTYTTGGYVLIARIHHVVGETAIYDYEVPGQGWIEDLRTIKGQDPDSVRQDAAFAYVMRGGSSFSTPDGVLMTDDYLVEASTGSPLLPMEITVAPGVVVIGETYRLNTAQQVILTVAPTANPRTDVVYVDAYGNARIKIGTEAGSPATPSTPAGSFDIAYIHHVPGETTIYDTETSGEGWIEDVRVAL
jgi:hypothetical protein